MLRPLGKIIQNQIKELEKRYTIEIDPYVIMPDHIHMVMKINRNNVGAEQSPAPTVGDMMCAFKSLTTKIANKYENCPGKELWQRGYYEHIIRDEKDYLIKMQYIHNNVYKNE